MLRVSNAVHELVSHVMVGSVSGTSVGSVESLVATASGQPTLSAATVFFAGARKNRVMKCSSVSVPVASAPVDQTLVGTSVVFLPL
jgi:hypothetical protein